MKLLSRIGLYRILSVLAPALRIGDFQRSMFHYQQTENIARALRLNDPTPGLREEGIELFAIFPQSGVARPIVRLRNELKN